ncbi:dTDP-4-dehydrorhamnose reductase family protein [Salegentibacter sp. T436]|uniref:dTDP-4-dehydrorhamnose reductase family protein n=1 Tax=Salegentibacter sp. T436 TaxID=1729720 RepID=UPI00094A31B2|nr:SDR family oxidoreductase [Salegentibacter sp. T436]APS37426.1 reductase [Salegentibacter sp. T436]
MRKKVMILGSTGMLGHQVYYKLQEDGKFDITDVSFRNKLTPQSVILDLHNQKELETLIKKVQPDFIINCVGVLIKGANDNPANAIYLNSYLPHFLAKECDEIGAKLIHISTDCVFSGEKGAYTENDEKDGRDIYAKTKALGEVENSNHLTLRTSIIGPELKQNGEGLFHWFMNQERETNGFTKAIWSGVTTTELAKVIAIALEQNLEGLYHVTNGNPINKYDLLKIFKEVTGKQISINAVEGKSVDKSFLDSRKELKRDIPSYTMMVKDMVTFMKSHPELYKNYSVALV